MMPHTLLRSLTSLSLLAVLAGLVPPALPVSPVAYAAPRSPSAASTAPGGVAPPSPAPPSSAPVPHPTPPPPSLPAHAMPDSAPIVDLHSLPLAFVPNQGQSAAAVRFQAHAMGGTTFLTADGIVLTLPAPTPPPTTAATFARTPGSDRPAAPAPLVARQRFVGANLTPQLTGVDPLPGVTNYLLGDDPAHWRTHVPTYAAVAYHDLYPGIDLRYDGAGGQLKSSYIVAPGADAAQIRWRYSGPAAVTLNPAGDLVMLLRGSASPLTATDRPGTLLEHAPVAWQEVGGRRVPIAVRYVIGQNQSVAFALGAYDHTRSLTIDPILTYSSYLGGSDEDAGRGVALDSQRNIYVVGSTRSTNFPTTNPLQANCVVNGWGSCEDVFVTKLNADGTAVLYSTYIGGSATDNGFGIAVDAAGSAYVAGFAASIDFPTTSGAWQTQCPWVWNNGCVYEDAFVLKLSPDGEHFIYNTLLGGIDHDQAYGIAIDGTGAAYVTGVTWTANNDLPPSSGAPQTTSGGDWDAFIAKVNTSGSALDYATYLGGSRYDSGQGIAVDPVGNAYVAGYTNSSDFPTTSGALQTTIGGSPACGTSCHSDGFVVRLNAAGTAFDYSTYLGGAEDDKSYAIAVDASGHAYTTGATWPGSSFPTTTGALQTTRSNYSPDAFVTELTPAGDALVYSTYLGGIYNDGAYAIALDGAGDAIIGGATDSNSGFPLVAASQPTHHGNYDAFVSVVSAAGDTLRFSTYLGGSGSDQVTGVATTDLGGIYVTGVTYSTDFPTVGAVQATRGGGASDAFVARLSPQLRPDQQRCPCSNHVIDAQNITPNPVNTRSGNFSTSATDLVVAGSGGPPLAFTRTYASQSVTETGALGPGWQQPFATRIITPGAPGGEANTLIVLSPENNRLRFSDLGGGHYAAWPGVYSTLAQGSGVFTQTLRDQQQWIFDATSGQLLAVQDPTGYQLDLTYSGSPPRLDRISDAADSSRFLELSYTSGRISALSDGVRTVQYSYDSAGNLVDVADVMNRHTTYGYQAPSSHLLTRVTNPLGQDVERIGYDAITPPRVITQTLQDGRSLAFTYLVTTTVLTTTGADGRQTIEEDRYAADNTLTGMRLNGEAVLGTSFDESLSPGVITDGNGNTTTTRYRADGLPSRVVNGLGQTEQYRYDAANNLVERTDAQGVTTRLRYNAANQVISTTLGITSTSPLRATTLYTYTAAGRLQEARAPDGVRTYNAYDSQNRVISTTIGYGTPLGQTTTYGYDALGRVVTTTIGFGTPLARTDITRYNADNTVARSIQNYQDGSFTPAVPDTDITTTYAYDELGRTVAVTDTLRHVSVTHYDAQGHVDWSARNASTPLQLDGYGQPLYHSYSRLSPDRNINTLYGYDGLGRAAFVTETGILTGTFDAATLRFSDVTTRTTRTEYDTLSRPMTVTLNYRPGLPASADTNVPLYTRYDSAGNVITQSDGLGRWTVMQYDTLNRPITVTLNYDDGDPLTGPADADLLTVTHYDTAGRVERRIDNYVNGAFTASEPITDRITLYQYDTLSRVITTTLNYDPPTLGTRTDTNRASVMRYDPATTRVLGSRDALGRWVSQQYDLLGRVTTTVQNCTGTSAPSTCGSQTADQNVATTTQYDAVGRVYETEDALNHVTHTLFDGAGRSTATIQNYMAGGPTTPITNVTTLTDYDGLGLTVVMTDELGYAIYTAYNGLGQTTIITDSVDRVTRMGYDASRALRWTRRNDGQLTVYQLDGLGRVVSTIANYQDGAVGASEPADQDMITQIVYDASGRRLRAIDTGGRTTAFAYDNQDRLIAVTENAVSGTCATAPCNVVTQYQYDRGGNRTAIVDANSHTRRFDYDAANQQIGATDPLTQTTSWEYDAGGRMTVQHDPRGITDTLTFSYDGLDRQTQTAATNLGTLSAQYDALGRRLSLTDGTGTTSFSYDPLGRVTQLNAPDTGTVSYGYDAKGQRTQLAYPGSTTLQYAYWPDGQIRTVTDTTTLASYSYDQVGRPQQVTRANGATTTYDYDGADRLIASTTEVSSTVVGALAYDVDRLGMRTVVTETLGAESTALVADIQPSSVGSAPTKGVMIGDTYFFAADDGTNGTELWKSVGTTSGTVLVKDIWSGSNSSSPNELTVVSDTLFFSANDGTNGTELWKSDGTASGTVLIKDIATGTGGSSPGSLTVVNGTLFFSANDGTNGTELWKSDGTSTGTVLVKDIRSGSNSSSPNELTAVSGTLFFTANDGPHGTELWKSDGTTAGTILVKDIEWVSRGGSSNPDFLTDMNGTLFFSAFQSSLSLGQGDELWKSDGTTAGTVLVKDIQAGSSGSFPEHLTVLNSTLFFSADDGTNGAELWKSDGTTSGTVLVKDIQSGSTGANPQALTAVSGMLFLSADDGTNGTELWKSDGTSTGTVLVKDIAAGSGSSSPDSLTTANGRVFFAAADGSHGRELWVSDGSAAGTSLLVDIVAGSGSSSLVNFTASGSRLFFSADDGSHGQELWLHGDGIRVVRYSYDGLSRLTDADETPGVSYTYSYDDAGNRTQAQANGVTVESHTYNAANQVVGYSYDAAGNLIGDGTTTYTYDALNRLIIRGTTPYTYNGDGVLVHDGATSYTQDLASPLSQVLQTTQGLTTTSYLYGGGRLASLSGSTRTWYLGDALGSVRRTLDDTGAVLGSTQYDPWGNVEGGAAPAPFGFTGELQDSVTGLVNLRARWYSIGHGTFTAFRWRTSESDDIRPYTHHPYAYALSNPVLWTDPSGQCQMDDDGVDCHQYPVNYSDPRHSVVCPTGWSWGGTSQPECLRNSDYTNLTTTDGVPIDIGVVVGVSVSCGVGGGGTGGLETVFDLYDLEVASFAYGLVGAAIGASGTAYSGLVGGWSSFRNGGVQNYRGMAGSLGVSLGIGPLSAQGGITKPDPNGGRLWVGSVGIGASLGAKVNGPILEELLQQLGKIPGIPSGGFGDYINLPHMQQTFHAPGKRPTYQDAWKFIGYLAQLSQYAPGMAALIPSLGAVALYNAHAWHDAEILRQR